MENPDILCWKPERCARIWYYRLHKVNNVGTIKGQAEKMIDIRNNSKLKIHVSIWHARLILFSFNLEQTICLAATEQISFHDLRPAELVEVQYGQASLWLSCLEFKWSWKQALGS